MPNSTIFSIAGASSRGDEYVQPGSLELHFLCSDDTPAHDAISWALGPDAQLFFKAGKAELPDEEVVINVVGVADSDQFLSAMLLLG
jgi:hypothetical protein